MELKSLKLFIRYSSQRILLVSLQCNLGYALYHSAKSMSNHRQQDCIHIFTCGFVYDYLEFVISFNQNFHLVSFIYFFISFQNYFHLSIEVVQQKCSHPYNFY